MKIDLAQGFCAVGRVASWGMDLVHIYDYREHSAKPINQIKSAGCTRMQLLCRHAASASLARSIPQSKAVWLGDAL